MNYTLIKSDMSSWPIKPIKAICTINPAKSVMTLDDDMDVSFVPMSDLNDTGSSFTGVQTGKVGDLRKAYTYFENNDVVFAKVTPCFENHKIGIARNLINATGFGSTEYFVLRPANEVIPEWLFICLTAHRFREKAVTEMTGTGGLKRIPKSVVAEHEVTVPPINQQTAIANILSDQETLVAHYNDLIALHEKRFAYLSDELLSGRLRLNVDGIASSNENWQMVSVNGDLVEIPADWETKKLGQTLTCLDSKRKPLNSKERASQKGLVPYWGANSIVDFVSGHLLDEDVVLLGEDAAPFFDKSKRVAFASHGKIWPNNHVHVLKPKDIDFSYAVYVLNQLPYEQIIGVTVRPKLTQSRMLDIDLVMPSRLEQALIANVLSDQEALIAEYKKLREAEQKRFDWLSDALLSGTYRVKMEA